MIGNTDTSCTIDRIDLSTISQDRKFYTINRLPESKNVAAVTFGRFDIFVDGVALEFSNRKAKELIAFCIDRMGATVSMDEAVEVLWAPEVYDEKAKRLYRKAALYAYRRLEEAGVRGLFIKSRGCCYIDRSKLDCDYYRYLESPVELEDSFRGEYMYNYSWGESTLAWLMGYRERWERKNLRRN